MHVEAGIEQPELGLEVLMYGRGLCFKRCRNEVSVSSVSALAM